MYVTDLKTDQSRLELQSIVSKKRKSVYFSIYSVFQYSVYLQKIQMFGDELSISM